ncbi:MAG: rhodanese-like domain-containing protein [Methylococcales bacterium]
MQRLQSILQAIGTARTRTRQAADEARTRIQEISAEEFDRRVAAATVLSDVRDEREFRTGHFSGAIRLGGEALKGGIPNFIADRSTPIVCYCALGNEPGQGSAGMIFLFRYVRQRIYDLVFGEPNIYNLKTWYSSKVRICLLDSC